MKCQRFAITQNNGFTTREEDGNLYVEGYFSVYNSKYWLWDEAYETIEPGAFEGQTNGDIRALTNHDSTLVLGRTTAGTLELREDEKGLWGRVTINQNDRAAMDLYERVKRGDVSQCSFGFDILDQEVEYSETGPTVWHIRKVKLYEVSVVTFPAYEETSVEARKNELKTIKKRKLETWKSQMKKKLKGE